MHTYNFHIGDYLTSTIHLSSLEDLAYRRLLDLYYSTERPIPTDIPSLSRRLRLGCDEIETVLNEFFQCTEDGWSNRRCEEEIEAYTAYIDRQRTNGKRGGRKPNKPTAKPSQSHRKPTANPPPSQPSTINHLPLSNSNTPIVPTSEDIYLAYPRHVSKPQALKAITKALKKIGAEDLLQKVREYKASCAGREPQFIPHPATWFNGERWNDEQLPLFPGTHVSSAYTKPPEQIEAESRAHTAWLQSEANRLGIALSELMKHSATYEHLLGTPPPETGL
jgi:uncharacterized protein YdaU (DUF1376 family)